MFCPKCGNQQTGPEVKYCSRCGLYLGVVTDILMGDGLLPGRVVAPPSTGLSPRKKGVRQGGKIFFISLAAMPLAIALSVLFDSPGPVTLAITALLGGLFWMLYHRLFTDDWPALPPQAYRPPWQAPPQHAPLLGAEAERARTGARQRINTAEMAPPTSVTDHTTQLFDKEE